MTEQLSIQLDPWLYNQIQQAADRQGQTVSDWCAALFEASLDPCEEPVVLVERVYRLEQIVARMGHGVMSNAPSSTRQAKGPLLTERQNAALDLVKLRWANGHGVTTAADLVGEDAGCDLQGPNAARMARGVLSALARKGLVQELRAGACIAVKPINAETAP